MTCGNKVTHTHNIAYCMLQHVYEIISFNSHTQFILKDLKQQETEL